MRLSCSVSAFFSWSAISNIASFATYSTSFSLIFIRKRNLLDPWRSPGFVELRQQLRSHLDELLAPDQVGNFDHDTGFVHGGDGRCSSQFGPDQRRPKLPENLQIEFAVPIR